MSRWRQVWTVAWWEFRRFYRLRDQVLAVVMTAVIGGLIYGGKKWADRSGEEVKVAVVNPPAAELVPPPESKVVFQPAGDRSEAELRAAVVREDLDGVLILDGLEAAELVVRKEPLWESDVRQALAAARGRVKLEEVNLTPAQLAEILKPVPVEVSIAEREDGGSQRALRGTATAFVILSVIGVIIGLSFILIGITGEKQQRVTEQVVSSISPQTWIDGKVIGLTLAAFGSIITYGLLALGMVVFLNAIGEDVAIPAVAGSPGVILMFVALAVLGILFWTCAFAAVAATMTDMYASSRSSLMILPWLPVMLVMFGIDSPDSVMMRVLAVLPGTSNVALPARMVLSEVSVLEILSALALLVGAIWLLRRLAGKIFGVGILIYGKEPGLREVWRWVNEA